MKKQTAGLRNHPLAVVLFVIAILVVATIYNPWPIDMAYDIIANTQQSVVLYYLAMVSMFATIVALAPIITYSIGAVSVYAMSKKKSIALIALAAVCAILEIIVSANLTDVLQTINPELYNSDESAAKAIECYATVGPYAMVALSGILTSISIEFNAFYTFITPKSERFKSYVKRTLYNDYVDECGNKHHAEIPIIFTNLNSPKTINVSESFKKLVRADVPINLEFLLNEISEPIEFIKETEVWDERHCFILKPEYSMDGKGDGRSYLEVNCKMAPLFGVAALERAYNNLVEENAETGENDNYIKYYAKQLAKFTKKTTID